MSKLAKSDKPAKLDKSSKSDTAKSDKSAKINDPTIPVKIKKHSYQSEQLVTFVHSLGVTDDLEIYTCNYLIYINIEILLPILSVELKWFTKNSETPLHYILIDKRCFINKYGITKLIAQSKEAVSLKLQDYLYELFYQAQTKDVIDVSEIKAKDAFTKEVQNIQKELNITKDALYDVADELKEEKIERRSLEIDYEQLEQDNNNLKDHINVLKLELKIMTDLANDNLSLANKLAKYVRVNIKNPPTEAFDDSLDTIYEDNDIITEDAIHDAVVAKLKLKNKIIVKSVSHNKSIYLCRTTDPIDISTNEYQWQIKNIVDDKWKLDSELYLIGEIDDINYPLVVYREIDLPDDKKNIFILMVSLNGSVYDEITINKMLDILNNN